MNKEQQARAMFVSFCIEQYAKAKNMATEDVVNLFEQYGIAEHFCEFYDVLHTQGGQWLVEEIDKMINERRKWAKYIPHLMIFPAIIISLLMICFNLFGNGLRDAFNPTLRGLE